MIARIREDAKEKHQVTLPIASPALPDSTCDLMKSFDELVATSASSDYCLFAYDTPNLGDAIQTLALLQHVRPRCFMLRDKPQPYPNLVLLGNGWMTDGPFPQTHQYGAVHYVGIHLDEQFRSAAVVDELRNCGIVGCRDTSTLQFLRANGVPAALCRCATLTFPRYRGERRGVVCVDVSEKTCARAVWKYARREKITRLSQVCDWLPGDCVGDGSWYRRLREAYDRLLLYRTAKLVITTKVHVTLPCIAFGTPVIYIGPRDERFGVFDGLDLGEGWEQFRWFRMLTQLRQVQPRPIPCDHAKATYFDFLKSVLTRRSRLDFGSPQHRLSGNG